MSALEMLLCAGVGLLIAAVPTALYLRGVLIRRRIVAKVKERGGKIRSIQPHRSQARRGTANLYRVEYADKDDKLRVAICQTALRGGFYWIDQEKSASI